MEAPGYRPFPNLGHRNFLQQRIEVPLFLRALRLRKRCRVLEVGCGRGVALPVLRANLQPTLLVGLDVELPFLREARGVAGARLVQGDIRHMPFPDAAFNLVVDFGTCYHIARSEAAVREIGRILAPEGVFATESKLAQMLAHPIRTCGRRLVLSQDGVLRPFRHAGMWRSFLKTGQ